MDVTAELTRLSGLQQLQAIFAGKTSIVIRRAKSADRPPSRQPQCDKRGRCSPFLADVSARLRVAA
jgi:hypothetical protein